MTVPARIASAWDSLDYQRIVSVEWRDGHVWVEFGDGTIARVRPSAIVGPETIQVDWTRLRVDGHHIVAPSLAGDIEIPWDVIRVHSDPQFAAFWQQLASETVPLETAVGGRSGG